MSTISDESFFAVRAIENLVSQLASSAELSDFDDVPLDALANQTRLAKLELPGRQLTGVSLTTLKKVANLHLLGGFERLDSFRVRAYSLLDAHRRVSGKPGRDTKDSLRKRAQELKAILELRQEDLMHMNAALRVAMGYMKEFAECSNDDATAARLAQALRDVRGRANQSSGFLSVVRT